MTFTGQIERAIIIGGFGGFASCLGQLYSCGSLDLWECTKLDSGYVECVNRNDGKRICQDGDDRVVSYAGCEEDTDATNESR